jgi:DNA-binding NtrC family response regulator
LENDLAGSELSGISILVLEDEYLIALDVEEMCRDHGAGDVTIMRSLAELTRNETDVSGFDLVILDVMLSGVPTIPFAQTLSERDIPFIFATGYSDHEAFFEPFGNVTVVAKPFRQGVMLAAIVDALTASGRIVSRVP